MVKTKKKATIGRKGEMIFQACLLAWPILQFCVFYIGVNANSFAMAFGPDVNVNYGGFFGKYKYVFNEMWPSIKQAMGMSVLFYVISTAISVPLALLFAYYIYKKCWGSMFFRLFLFLPSILSGMVMVTLFHQFVDFALPAMVADIVGKEYSEVGSIVKWKETSSYIWVLAFHIWIGFGTTTLIYSNKMSEISPEMVEAAALDGATNMQEFWYIILPFTYPTLSVFLVTGLATIFTNQYHLYSFYSSSITSGLKSGTIGYYIYNGVQGPASAQNWESPSFERYAAVSLFVTAIIIPVALTARWAVDKFGPSED